MPSISMKWTWYREVRRVGSRLIAALALSDEALENLCGLKQERRRQGYTTRDV